MKDRELALQLIPESPRHVIPRSMLLHGQSELLGPVASGSFAIHDIERSTLALIGSPAPKSCMPDSMPPIVVAVSQAFDTSPWPAYRWQTLDVLTLEIRHPTRRAPGAAAPAERLPSNFPIDDAAEDLRFALGVGLSLGPVFAVRKQGTPVAAACCFWRSQHYYDISIDTLPEHRRRGLGHAVAAALIDELAPANAVHCSSTDDQQARHFIESLGFQRVGEIRIGKVRDS